MDEKPRIVVSSRKRRVEPASGLFTFTHEMLKLEGPLKDYRQKAWDEFSRLPLPTTKEESWRRTDLRNLPADRFNLLSPGFQQVFQPVPDDLLQPLAGSQHGGQILLLPDQAQVNLDPDLVNKGVIFTDLQTAEVLHPDLVERMAGEIVLSQEGKFAAMAAAFAGNGVVLYVPKGVIIEQPLHSVLWGGGYNMAHISHLLIWVDEGASLTYVHESASPHQIPNLHAGLVELKVSDGANLRFVELQSWGDQVWNFSHERAQVGRDANLDWIFGAIGSQVPKN